MTSTVKHYLEISRGSDDRPKTISPTAEDLLQPLVEAKKWDTLEHLCARLNREVEYLIITSEDINAGMRLSIKIACEGGHNEKEDKGETKLRPLLTSSDPELPYCDMNKSVVCKLAELKLQEKLEGMKKESALPKYSVGPALCVMAAFPKY